MSSEGEFDSEIHEDESKTASQVPVSEDTLKDLIDVSVLLQDEIPNMRKRIEMLELGAMTFFVVFGLTVLASLRTAQLIT